MVYVIGGMKFSLGKVRTSVNFVLYLANIKKRKVILVDTDPSTYASEYIKWINDSGEFESVDTLRLGNGSIEEELERLKASYDDIVIDSGVGENLMTSLLKADRFIVPFNAKDLGLWAVWTKTNIETAIDRTLEFNPELKSYSFLISKPGEEKAAKDISAVLRKSQYLNFLESKSILTMFEGEYNNVMKSLKDLKQSLPIYTLGELVDEVSA